MRMALLLPAVAALAWAQTHENLNSVLWAQGAVEYRGAALQAYQTARAMLDRALKNKDWTAAVEQKDRYRKLPPAIVLDIDETILDNSPSHARMIRQNLDFDTAVWEKWVAEANAQPIPGALEFTRYAASRGIAVFYITNREQELEEATRRNLGLRGFPMRQGVDVVLTRGEKQDWSSDKGSRRAEIAARYRILLLIGDDLGDFLSGIRVGTTDRHSLAKPYEHYWGTKWIMIPNASYGSWEAAHYGFDHGLSHDRKRELKHQALQEK